MAGRPRENEAATYCSTYFDRVPGDDVVGVMEAQLEVMAPFTVRALACVLAGHAAHHVAILKERYLGAPASNP